MYYVVTELEISTGFLSSSICKDELEGKEGLKLVNKIVCENHKHAIKVLIAEGKDNRKHNVAIDPNYTPRSKRGK